MTKVQFKRQVSEEIEIKFPMYIKTEGDLFYYAIHSENDIQCVSKENGIKKSFLSVAFSSTYTEITEKEFMDFYRATVTKQWDDFEAYEEHLKEMKSDDISYEKPLQDELEYQQRRSA